MDEPASLSLASATFVQSVLPHRDAAYNLAFWLLRHDHDAEDCVQEAYLRAYRAFDRFHGVEGRAWLLAIVRNVCYSRLRQSHREEPPASFDEVEHGTVVAYAVSELAWPRAVAKELLPLAMEKLQAEAREILVLHAVEGCAYKEIAAILEIPIGTVMSRLARSRLKLQQELSQLLQKDLPHGT